MKAPVVGLAGLLLASMWCGPIQAASIFFDLRVSSQYSPDGSCAVTGADTLLNPCTGYAGYAASLYDPQFPAIVAEPFSRSLAASSEAVSGPGDGGGHSASGSASAWASVLTGDGSLARFRTSSPGIVESSLARTSNYGFVQLRIRQPFDIQIPAGFAGAVAMTLSVPFDGTVLGYNPTTPRLDLYPFTQFALTVSSEPGAASGAFSASDAFTTPRATTPVAVAGSLTTGPLVIRQPGSSATRIPVVFALDIISGTIGTGEVFDFDFASTVGLQLVVAPGVTASSDSAAFSALLTPVPEPQTSALALAGLAVVARALRRRAGAPAAA